MVAPVVVPVPAPVAPLANFQSGIVVGAAHPAQANVGSPAPGGPPPSFGTMLPRGAGVEASGFRGD